MRLQEQTVEQVQLEAFQVGFSRSFSEEGFAFTPELHGERFGAEVAFHMRTFLFGTKPATLKREIQTPATWFDHWLYAYRGRWFTRRLRAPRFKTHVLEVETRAVFPDITAPGRRCMVYSVVREPLELYRALGDVGSE